MTNRSLQYIVKDQEPLTRGPKASLQEACQDMWTRRVGAVMVVDDGRLVGIFTGRDAVHALSRGFDPRHTLLATAMTPAPDTIPPEATAIDALRRMRDCGYRHLPIVDRGRIVGIVSRGDFQGLELDRLEGEDALWERIC